MRIRSRLALLGLAVVFSAALVSSAADEPAPLLKVVTPAGTNLRVRIPVTPGFPKVVSFPAQVPNGKKKSELMDVHVAYDALPNPSYISAKKLESWGYTVPKGAREFVLPELLITGAQIAPNPANPPKGAKAGNELKGSDVVIKLTNVKLTVVPEAAAKDDSIHFNDFSLSATSLFGNNERTMEPRLSFADKFLELTVPVANVKRPGTETVSAPEVSVSPDTKLAPAFGPTMMRSGLPVFVFASINGQDTYTKPDMKTIVPVNVSVSSITNMSDGVMVTLGLARGVKIEMEANAAGQMATGVEAKSEFIPGKIKELRLMLMTGPGMKTQKDLVIKDLPVMIDKNQSEGYMLIGQKFIDAYFTDGVYSNAGDGWKLHGRVNPELLFDIKTRKQPEKKP